MTNTQSVIESIEQLGQAHRALDRQRDEAQAQARTLAGEIVEALASEHDELFVEDEDDEQLSPELIAESITYLTTGEDSGRGLWPELLVLLDAVRGEESSRFERIAASVDGVDVVRRRKIAVDAEMAAWGQESPRDEWPSVLAAWRSALNLTTREAAAVFGVSASAITRYESGSRSPSEAQLAAMIAHAAKWDVAQETGLRTGLRGLAATGGWDYATTVDRFDAERRALEGQLEELIGSSSLSVDALRLLVALASNPAGLKHLDDFVSVIAATPVRTEDHQTEEVR